MRSPPHPNFVLFLVRCRPSLLNLVSDALCKTFCSDLLLKHLGGSGWTQLETLLRRRYAVTDNLDGFGGPVGLRNDQRGERVWKRQCREAQQRHRCESVS
jgi:hypothetical protein